MLAVEALSSVVAKHQTCKKESVKRRRYIVEDVCGHYEIMEPDEWAEVKDDTIEDVADAPEEVPAVTSPENTEEA